MKRDQILVTADRRRKDPFAIDGELDLLRIFQASHGTQVRAIETHLKLVFAIQRKRVCRPQAANGAERQPLEVHVL